MQIAEDPITHAKLVARDCEYVAIQLALKGQRIQLGIQTLRVVSTLIGILSLLASYFPVGAKVAGTFGSEVLTVVAALTLILGSMAFMVIGKNPPERLADYSYYIGGYAFRIEEIVANDMLDATVKKLRLIEVTRLATGNLQDVQSKWPSAMPQRPPNGRSKGRDDEDETAQVSA
jgi:hypothetical protein